MSVTSVCLQGSLLRVYGTKTSQAKAEITRRSRQHHRIPSELPSCHHKDPDFVGDEVSKLVSRGQL